MTLEVMSLEKLSRKANQEWEMAALARADGDRKDEAIHTQKAQEYVAEINRRRSVL